MPADLRARLLAGALLLAVGGCQGPVSTPVAIPTPSAVTSPSVAASPTSEPTVLASPTPPAPVLGDFDAPGALAFATALAELGTREAGTPGDERARAVITDAFEDAGWHVVAEDVELPQGGRTANLLAVRDLADLDQPHVVIGGHHDTIGGAPGANDNGSGIGVLAMLAAELADEPSEVPLVLVAFGAEEYQPSTPREHHLGSQQYADQRGDVVVAALIVDMVGNGSPTCLCWLRNHSRTLVDRLEHVAAGASLTGYQAEARGDISDHGPFAHAGIPAAFLWTYDDGVKHTPADTADRLRVEDFRRAGNLALAFARTLAAADLEGLRPSP